MQCEVRTSETSARSRGTRTSDTLPKPGRVTEVCKEWLVHEDGALAYKLQKEEVEHHLTGNKSRNAIVREDFPRAREEQRKEVEEAMATTTHQEEADAAVARQLAQRIEQEDEERRRRLEQHDIRVARHIQERELKKNRPNQPPLQVPSQLVGDVNRVGLPDISEVASAQFRGLSVRDEWSPVKQDEDHEFTDEEQRRIQELQDEELARLLQEQEARLRGEGVDQLDRDRLMAIEAQDKELAKLLQERERAKARRARERAKQKALLKKQQEAATGEEAPTTSSPTGSSNETAHRHRQRYSDPEAIEVLSPGGSPLPNIAMVIDPTYSPHSTPCTPPSEFEEYDEGPVPPYMPIQGQRRTSSLEKKHKKKQAKDGCKQQ